MLAVRSILSFILVGSGITDECLLADTPLATKSDPNPTPSSEPITNTTIYTCIAAPPPSAIQTILKTLLSTSDITSCLSTINTLKASQGLALADILTALGEQLNNLNVPAQTKVSWLEGLAEIEWRLSGGGGEAVQTGGLVGVVRNGVELMEKTGKGGTLLKGVS